MKVNVGSTSYKDCTQLTNFTHPRNVVHRCVQSVHSVSSEWPQYCSQSRRLYSHPPHRSPKRWLLNPAWKPGHGLYHHDRSTPAHYLCRCVKERQRSENKIRKITSDFYTFFYDIQCSIEHQYVISPVVNSTKVLILE